MTDIPILETTRLILRPHTLADLGASAAMWGDADFVKYIRQRPFTEHECWRRLQIYVGHWSLMGFGFWAMEARDDGRFIGEVGLMDHRREEAPQLHGIAEAGWVVTPAESGRGFAQEGMEAALNWFDDAVKTPRTVCIIDPNNHASLRIADKLGYANPSKIPWGDLGKDVFAMVMERLLPSV